MFSPLKNLFKNFINSNLTYMENKIGMLLIIKKNNENMIIK